MKEISFITNIKKTKRVLKVVKEASLGFFIVFILQSIFTSIFPYISIYFTYKIIDGIVLEVPQGDILYYVYWMIGLNFIVGILLNILQYYNKIYSVAVTYNIDNKIADKTFDIDYATLEDNKTMKLIQMAEEGSNGNGGIVNYCVYILNGILSSILSIVYGVILLLGLLKVKDINSTNQLTNFLNSPWSFIVIVLAVFLPAILSMIVLKKENKKSYDIMMYNIEGNRQLGYFYRIAYNYKFGKDIRLFHMQDMFLKRMKDLREKADEHWRNFSIFKSKMMAISISGNKVLALMAYFYVGLKAIYGLVSVGNLVAYVAAITLVSQAITTIVERYSKLHLYNNYLENYFTYLNLESTKEYGDVELNETENLSIRFSNVSFKYPNTDKNILKNINLEINQGSKLAIVGLNGSGKTTLIKLICRLYDPDEGVIYINEVPLKEYSKEACTKLFSIVFQDFKLFSYSIKDNIASGLNGDEDKVRKVLNLSGMKERVSKMPQNIDTIIYQRSKAEGVEISGGEAQKLAISRALYKDSPVVILDEPTAALDPKSEAEIYEKFNELVENKTAIFISHRMSSCKFCDNIIVLDNGMIKERGTHINLLADMGLYQKMWNAQAKYYN